MCSYNTITCLLFVNSEQLQYMALDNVRIWAKCKCTFILTVLAFWIATRHIHSMSRFLYCNSKTERDRPHCVAIEVASSTTKQMKVLDLFFSDGYNTHIIIPKIWNSEGKFARLLAVVLKLYGLVLTLVSLHTEESRGGTWTGRKRGTQNIIRWQAHLVRGTVMESSMQEWK